MNNTEAFTGHITEELQQNIEEIYDKGHNKIVKGMANLAENYFGELKYAWCSEKAVEFYSMYADKLVDAINQTDDDILNLCKRIEEAHNVLALSNSANLITVDVERFRLLSLPQLMDNLGGVIGMNIDVVKFQTKYYTHMMNSLLGQLENLPLKISLLDPGKDLLITYQHLLQETTERIRSIFTEIVNKVTEAMETETSEVKLNKEYAQQILSGQS